MTTFFRKCVLVSFSFIILFAIISSNQQAVDYPGKEKAYAAANTLLPQGWSFFTKDPRYPRIRIYEVYNGSYKDVTYGGLENGHKNFYGLDRMLRIRQAERENIDSQIEIDKYIECTHASLEECFSNPSISLTEIENNFRNPSFCGEYYIGIYDPVPWSWRDLEPEKTRLVSAGKVKLNC